MKLRNPFAKRPNPPPIVEGTEAWLEIYDDDDRVRSRAVRRLADDENPHAVTELLRIAGTDWSLSLRKTARECVTERLKNADAAELLRYAPAVAKAFQGSDFPARYGDPAVLTIVIAHASVRVASRIRRHFRTVKLPHNAEAVRLLAGTTNPLAEMELRTVFEALPDEEKLRLAESLQSSRNSIARALAAAWIPDLGAVDELLFLTDDDPRVRQEIRARIADPRVHLPILRASDRPEAMWAIAEIDPSEGVERALADLGHRRANVRVSALEILRRFGDADMARRAVPLLLDPSSKVVRAAVRLVREKQVAIDLQLIRAALSDGERHASARAAALLLLRSVNRWEAFRLLLENLDLGDAVIDRLRVWRAPVGYSPIAELSRARAALGAHGALHRQVYERLDEELTLAAKHVV